MVWISLLSMLWVALLSVACAWDYIKSGSDWTETCITGKTQSPINLDKTVIETVTSDSPHHMTLVFNFTKAVVFGGFTADTYKIKGELGELSAYKGDDPWTHNGIIDSFHFHSPSENLVDGKQYELEMHIVMVDQENIFKYIVFGIMFNVGEITNPFIDQVIQANNAYSNFSLSSTFISEKINNFYNFLGSLTTPPCSETVYWLVDSNVRSLTSEQLSFFTNRWAGNSTFANNKGNNRETQNINGRKVIYYTIPNNFNCDVGSGPIATMSVLVFLMIFFSLIFIVTDKVVKEVPVLIFKPLLVYPLTGLFFKQPNPLRVALIIQLLTCELLLLALIGAFHQYFDDPTKPNDFNFSDYYGSQMSRGAAAWALCQTFTIPIYFINAYNVYKKKKLHYITIPICIIISLLCFGAIVAMTTQYCAGITKFWIVNFLIFLLLDIATLEIIYALIATYLLYRSFVHSSKEITSGVSLEAGNKNDGKRIKFTPDHKIEVSKTSKPLISNDNEPEIFAKETFNQNYPNSDREN